jgi:hypothetical protein
MKQTTLKNPFSGEFLMEIEESDMDFSLNWDDLSLEQKADFCFFIKAPFLKEGIEPLLKIQWEYFQSKNL